MSLYLGLFLSLLLILFDSSILFLGIKKIDPLENLNYLTKIGLPASIIEILYLIWALYNLPDKIIYLLIITPLLSLIVKGMKINGYKFILYVITPLTEICVVITGIIVLLTNK